MAHTITIPTIATTITTTTNSTSFLWHRIAQITQDALQRQETPLLWAVDVGSCLHEAGSSIPSLELASLLLTTIFDVPENQTASDGVLTMGYMEHAISSGLVFPLHALALLTSKGISGRTQRPKVYMAYLGIVDTFIFSISLRKNINSPDRIFKLVDDTLELSSNSTSPISDLGAVTVHFLVFLVQRLADATAEDWNTTYENHNRIQDYIMAESGEDLNKKRNEDLDQIKRSNSIKAIEVLTKVMKDKRTVALLRLARINLPEKWSMFMQKLQLLQALVCEASSAVPREAPEVLEKLASTIQTSLHQEWKPEQMPVIQTLLDKGSCIGAFGNGWGSGRTAAWLPFDIFMEDAMEGRRVPATSTAEALADLMKSLQAVQGSTWDDLFLGLWTAALRHMNREREHVDGPKPHIESRLCMVLSILPLASAAVIDEEERSNQYVMDRNGEDNEGKFLNTRRAAFISSLQVLGQFESLLSPPQLAVAAANQAAATASSYVAGIRIAGTRDGHMSSDSSSNKIVGNMRHLIVEVCIARGLLDTSAYLWPGYAMPMSSFLLSTSSQASPWSAFMEGAPITGPLCNSLMSTPATSLVELEKIYQIAINGEEKEKVAAASILCGASLLRGWNVQEHAVRLAVKLFSPAGVVDNRVAGSPLIPYASMLAAALGAFAVDAVHILSLYGMFPELAAALLPICEVFGSLSPTLPLGDNVSVHIVFSSAFLLLLKLWKFHRPPLDHRLLGIEPPIGGNLSLDYLLQLRNTQISSSFEKEIDGDINQTQTNKASLSGENFTNGKPEVQAQHVSLDYFPKLKAWYTQNQVCIASTLSGFARGNPVHQIADRLLNMMFKRMNKQGSNMVSSPSSSSSNSSGLTGSDDLTGRPQLPAWELMAAVPFVADAVLTACAHGKLSSKDLTTGLRDLVDFLPASIASIVSYFTAEVTRGLWKYASMNGNDWPSPAANLLAVEAEIKDILAATGVHVPSLVAGSLGGNAPASLPLPLAALVSLTITFKLDKPSDIVLGVAGPALESTASGSPWPSMAIVAALWVQKIKRWHEYLVFSASRTAFTQDKDAVKQLLRSCLSATLGSDSSLFPKLKFNGGVGALLGHENYTHSSLGGPSPVAPGILYLCIYPSLHDIMFVTNEILMLVAETARDLVSKGIEVGRMKRETRLKCSFSTSIARVLQASTLGASLLHVTGGSSLVQTLYSESLPTWFLSGNNFRTKSSSQGTVLEGYAIAHFSLLSGALAWGVAPSQSPTTQSAARSSLNALRQRVLSSHMDFLASALDGMITVGCEQTTWKAYVLGFLALLVTCTPGWIQDIKIDVLKKLAKGVRFWHEHDLAVALLEKAGIAAMGAAAELV